MKNVVLCIAVLLLAACSGGQPQTVEVTRVVEVTAPGPVATAVPVEVTRAVEVTTIVEVKVTQLVEVTTAPKQATVVREVTVILWPSPEPRTIVTATPERTEALVATEASEGASSRIVSDNPEEAFALNNLGSQESGGVTIEIARVLIARRSALPPETNEVLNNIPAFEGKDVVGMIVFRVTNNADARRIVHPMQGQVIIGGEQIQLTDSIFVATFGENVGGEIFPGVTRIGGIYFGIARSDVPEVQRMQIAITSSSDEDFSSLGEDYFFDIDLSNHEFQPIPNELQQ